MAVPTIDLVLEGMKAGKSVIDILKGLKGRRLTPDEKWYLDKILDNYNTERIVNEYKEGIKSLSNEYKDGAKIITNHLSSLEKTSNDNSLSLEKSFNENFSRLEKSTDKLYNKIEGLMEGILVGRGYEKKD